MKIIQEIGLIGAGNMGQAILEGLLKRQIALPGQIWVYDKIRSKVSPFKRKWKVYCADTLENLVKRTQIVILAFKPQDLSLAGENVKTHLKSSHVLISILAGTPLAKIKRFVGSQAKMVRAMPNLGAKVGEAMTCLAGSDARALAVAEKIFSGCGKTLRLQEKHFDLVTAVSGSGPAYFFLMMEGLVAACLREGLSEETAELLAVQTAVGASLLARSSALSPGELRRMVTSKRGTTEAALKILEARKFPQILQQAVRAALERGRQLSRI